MYNAGPISISISCWEEKIFIKTTNEWKHLLDEFIGIAKLAWCLEDSQIVYESNSSIKISINYATLKLYIEHSIIYV